jgi:UDP-2-acetamido-2,6-beta-L-arabino-hexul-4-ose reductase
MSLKMEELPVHADERGMVFEPIGPDELPAQRNIHVVRSQPGAIRGNHYHLQGTETIAVSGPALVRFRKDGELQDIPVANGKISRFTFLPGIPHAIKNTGDSPNILVAFNTIEHDPQHSDTVEFLLIE